MGVSSHLYLAKRAMEHVNMADPEDWKIPQWGVAVLVVEALMYFVIMFKIRYSLGKVISTLSIVEESSSRILLTTTEYRDADGKDAKATDGLLEPEVMQVKTVPVTSKLRTAKKHLKANGGRFALFRGFRLYVVYSVLKNIVITSFARSMPRQAGALIGTMLAEVLLAKIQMAWVHQVISMPSSKSMFTRINGGSGSWRQIAPAAAVRAVAMQVAIGLPAALLCSSPVIHRATHGGLENVSRQELHALSGLFITAAASALLLLFLVVIPAHVIFVRVAASLLPAEEETIVDFDRRFGGKTPANGQLTLLEAWKTFKWEQRRRYIKVLAKVVLISTAVTVLFASVAGAEVQYFLSHKGDESL